MFLNYPVTMFTSGSFAGIPAQYYTWEAINASDNILNVSNPASGELTPYIYEKNGYHASQSLSANQPIFIPNEYNEILPALRFDSDDYMIYEGLAITSESMSFLATNASTSLTGVITPTEAADATYILNDTVLGGIKNTYATGVPGQYLGTAGPSSTPVVRFATGEYYTVKSVIEANDNFSEASLNLDRWVLDTPTDVTLTQEGGVLKIIAGSTGTGYLDSLRGKVPGQGTAIANESIIKITMVNYEANNSVTQRVTFCWKNYLSLGFDISTFSIDKAGASDNDRWSLIRNDVVTLKTDYSGDTIWLKQHKPAGQTSFNLYYSTDGITYILIGVSTGQSLDYNVPAIKLDSNRTTGKFEVHIDEFQHFIDDVPAEVIYNQGLDTPLTLSWYGKYTTPTSDQLLLGDTTTGTGIGVGSDGLPYATDGTTKLTIPISEDFEYYDFTSPSGSVDSSLLTLVSNFTTTLVENGYLELRCPFGAAQTSTLTPTSIITNQFGSSDFEFSIDATNGGGGGYADPHVLKILIGGVIYSIGRTYQNPTYGGVNGWYASNGTTTSTGSDSSSTYTLKLKRVGSTIYAFHKGVEVASFTGVSGSVGNIEIYSFGWLPGAGGFTFRLYELDWIVGTGLSIIKSFAGDFYTIVAKFDGTNSSIDVTNYQGLSGDLSLADINTFQILPGAIAADMIETSTDFSVDKSVDLEFSQPFTVNCISKFTTPASDKIIFGNADLNMGVGSDGIPYIESTVSGKIQAQAPVSGDWSGDWHIFTGIFDGANSEIRVDNSYVTSGDIGTSSTLTVSQLGEEGLIMDLNKIKLS